jgi:Ca2+-binding RTX toxin-like protein
MRGIRKVKRRLRAERPRPSDALRRELRASMPSRAGMRPQWRLGLLSAATVVLLSGLAVVGGAGYAATAAHHAVKAVKRVALPARVVHAEAPTAALDQYGNPTGGGTQDVRGSSRSDAVTTGGGSDRVFSGGGNDRITSGGGKDNVSAGGGNDRVNAGAGNDNVNGGAGNDRINAGTGNDRIIGGPGRDTISAGSGNDKIYVRDGSRDIVNCGTGRDTVIADAGKTDKVAGNCERVLRGKFKT